MKTLAFQIGEHETAYDIGKKLREKLPLDLASFNTAEFDKDGIKGADIASATLTDLSLATGQYVHITGTVTITGLGTAPAGTIRYLRFMGILTFTYNATSLILPTAASITTAANDRAIMVSEGAGNWFCFGYFKASGAALA